MIEPPDLMQLAIEAARQGITAGQSPFGCAIARDGQLLSAEHNMVLMTADITAHAEITAIRVACRRVGDIFLSGAIVATTCEPCPMCMAALHWARVKMVYYGATIADADAIGFNELCFPSAELLQRGGSNVRLVGGILTEKCRELMAEWSQNPARQTY
jgi:tRNA(Arg) A34 adenosine deaminase TadA